MICNKFIVAQRSCDLRRHLDGAAAEASIGDIVDSCRIWESHAEHKKLNEECRSSTNAYIMNKYLIGLQSTCWRSIFCLCVRVLTLLAA